jgi:hypothetical protein
MKNIVDGITTIIIMEKKINVIHHVFIGVRNKTIINPAEYAKIAVMKSQDSGKSQPLIRSTSRVTTDPTAKECV